MDRCYSEFIQIPSFKERYEYLRLNGIVGQETFGYDRYLNQAFYRSSEWKRVRNQIIVRDCGCDLGVEGFEINDKILIHHMNPITIDDIVHRPEYCLNPEFLISVSIMTHEAIHYGDESLLVIEPIQRLPNDTIPWR